MNSNRLIGGGHGQEALDYMDAHGIEYKVEKTYKNGVRVGNVSNHSNKYKKSHLNQSWFPRFWKRDTIKKAGQSVARGEKLPDGKIKTGFYRSVKVGTIRTDGKIGTIFPMSKQTNKKGELIRERRTTKINHK